MNYSEQILKARFEQLPEDIKKAIMATPWEEKLKRISDKHNLHIDQAERLGEETVIVMFGLEHPSNLVANIAKHAEISEEKAEVIAEDLNQEIFLKVRDSLKKIFEEKKEVVEEKKSNTEEIPSREDILREIENKEHRNLPSVNKTERHLETPFPNEIVEQSTNSPRVETPPTSEVVPNEQVAFQNQKTTNETAKGKAFETNVQSEQTPQKPFESKDEALRTMPKDIIKAKMEGIVRSPKEMVEMSDVASPKVKLPDVEKKIDPYREQVE